MRAALTRYKSKSKSENTLGAFRVRVSFAGARVARPLIGPRRRSYNLIG